jgi:hypothetical protein
MNQQVVVKQVETLQELEEICSLNLRNLRNKLSEKVQEEEGFLTLEYPLEKLIKMAELEKPIIAVYENHVIGYVLATPKLYRGIYEPIDDSFNVMASLKYKGQSIYEYNFLYIGQICIAKEFRSHKTIFTRMYQHYQQSYGLKYDFAIIDISVDNNRWLNAHLKNGFQLIRTLTRRELEWSFILWDWLD